MELWKKKGLVLQVLGLLWLEGFILCMANGNITQYNWVLQETSYTRLCSTKKILTVNGLFPGPILTAYKGQTLIVNVHNKGSYNVTIHWHGVKQPRNPWSDGPEFITQCPIRPGGSFQYKVILSTEEGTIWWHAHSDWSRATVHGALIVLPKPGTTYPFPKPDGEMPIMLASWFKGDVMEIIEHALETGGEPNQSDAFTINGQTGALYKNLFNCSKLGTFKMMVEYGKTYLLRVINGVMNEEMFFAIAKHTLTVVGTDGSYIKPLTTNHIMIVPGQTMDILLKANKKPGHYYMAARAFSTGDNVGFDNTTTTAIIQYTGKYSPPSSPSFPSLPYFNDTNAANKFTSRLRSLANAKYPISVPLKIDTQLIITISVNTQPCLDNSCDGPNGTALSASMNNISFINPSIDILEAYYKNISSVYRTDFPNEPPFYFNFTTVSEFDSEYAWSDRGTKVRVLEYNATVEVVFQGTNLIAAENHPMHLHGFSFYWVGSGYGIFDRKKGPKTYNLVDPPEVNMVGVPKNGWAAIRFKADNPGVWYMHCHLERHTSWGMMTVFIVKNGHTKEAMMLPRPADMPPC